MRYAFALMCSAVAACDGRDESPGSINWHTLPEPSGRLLDGFTWPHSVVERALAMRQMTLGGGVLTLRLADYDSARRFLDALELCSHSPNLGDSRTIVTRPASTTHSKLTEDERGRVGITPGLLRVSVLH